MRNGTTETEALSTSGKPLSRAKKRESLHKLAVFSGILATIALVAVVIVNSLGNMRLLDHERGTGRIHVYRNAHALIADPPPNDTLVEVQGYISNVGQKDGTNASISDTPNPSQQVDAAFGGNTIGVFLNTTTPSSENGQRVEVVGTYDNLGFVDPSIDTAHIVGNNGISAIPMQAQIVYKESHS